VGKRARSSGVTLDENPGRQTLVALGRPEEQIWAAPIRSARTCSTHASSRIFSLRGETPARSAMTSKKMVEEIADRRILLGKSRLQSTLAGLPEIVGTSSGHDVLDQFALLLGKVLNEASCTSP